MSQQFKILGWIFVAFGILGTLGMLVVGVILVFQAYGMSWADSLLTPSTPHVSYGSWTQWLMGNFIYVIALIYGLAVTVFLIVSGGALIKRKPSARTMIIVASALCLLSAPVGTILGVYGLWLMFSTQGTAAWSDYISVSADSRIGQQEPVG